jgi:hypothetical protein
MARAAEWLTRHMVDATGAGAGAASGGGGGGGWSLRVAAGRIEFAHPSTRAAARALSSIVTRWREDQERSDLHNALGRVLGAREARELFSAMLSRACVPAAAVLPRVPDGAILPRVPPPVSDQLPFVAPASAVEGEEEYDAFVRSAREALRLAILLALRDGLFAVVDGVRLEGGDAAGAETAASVVVAINLSPLVVWKHGGVPFLLLLGFQGHEPATEGELPTGLVPVVANFLPPDLVPPSLVTARPDDVPWTVVDDERRAEKARRSLELGGEVLPSTLAGVGAGVRPRALPLYFARVIEAYSAASPSVVADAADGSGSGSGSGSSSSTGGGAEKSDAAKGRFWFPRLPLERRLALARSVIAHSQQPVRKAAVLDCIAPTWGGDSEPSGGGGGGGGGGGEGLSAAEKVSILERAIVDSLLVAADCPEAAACAINAAEGDIGFFFPLIVFDLASTPPSFRIAAVLAFHRNKDGHRWVPATVFPLRWVWAFSKVLLFDAAFIFRDHLLTNIAHHGGDAVRCTMVAAASPAVHAIPFRPPWLTAEHVGAPTRLSQCPHVSLARGLSDERVLSALRIGGHGGGGSGGAAGSHRTAAHASAPAPPFRMPAPHGRQQHHYSHLQQQPPILADPDHPVFMAVGGGSASAVGFGAGVAGVAGGSAPHAVLDVASASFVPQQASSPDAALHASAAGAPLSPHSMPPPPVLTSPFPAGSPVYAAPPAAAWGASPFMFFAATPPPSPYHAYQVRSAAAAAAFSSPASPSDGSSAAAHHLQVSTPPFSFYPSSSSSTSSAAAAAAMPSHPASSPGSILIGYTASGIPVLQSVMSVPYAPPPPQPSAVPSAGDAHSVLSPQHHHGAGASSSFSSPLPPSSVPGATVLPPVAPYYMLSTVPSSSSLPAAAAAAPPGSSSAPDSSAHLSPRHLRKPRQAGSAANVGISPAPGAPHRSLVTAMGAAAPGAFGGAAAGDGHAEVVIDTGSSAPERSPRSDVSRSQQSSSIDLGSGSVGSSAVAGLLPAALAEEIGPSAGRVRRRNRRRRPSRDITDVTVPTSSDRRPLPDAHAQPPALEASDGAGGGATAAASHPGLFHMGGVAAVISSPLSEGNADGEERERGEAEAAPDTDSEAGPASGGEEDRGLVVYQGRRRSAGDAHSERSSLLSASSAASSGRDAHSPPPDSSSGKGGGRGGRAGVDAGPEPSVSSHGSGRSI